MARACTIADGSLLRNSSENERQQPRWTASVMVGFTEPATAALNTVTLQVDKGVKEKKQFLIHTGSQLSSCKYAIIKEGSVYDPRTVVNVRCIPCCI